ncbi:Isy1-like splicing factor [Syncephalis pseudoplumigaleata]|uniref:Isy1-like splicing factor n=1 Tax=Syncephalis pseudoplumigaleata TaxID=1712513 RepID=A0A4P9YZ41_9FUNG|nr:Isy1-like splicing factor [Syncephalis pseudoplumigaleata]|eukprot:RKP25433.1 Isy1-like splicing factor [Syncephalis pseudoplumigaleata]
MARNQEKAQSMLHRFRQIQAAEAGVISVTGRRPPRASSCNNINEVEQWRQHFIQEISRKVSQIQNVGLPEAQIRELNDEINRLMRVKRAWEHRLKDLGGADYTRVASRMLDAEGREIPGTRGYKYFGRAKELPGVRELLEAQTLEPTARVEVDLYKRVDADYYGYRDEEDGALLAYEKEQAEEAWQQLMEQYGDTMDVTTQASAATDVVTELINGKEGVRVHVNVPTASDVEAFLVRRRKQQLMDRYAAQD